MHTINVRALTLQSLLKQFPSFTAADFLETVERTGQAFALETSAVDVKEERLVAHTEDSYARNSLDVPALVFIVDDVDPVTLLSLANGGPEEYNENSADLLTSTTYLGWKTAGVEVRINSRHLRTFPGEMETRRFIATFVSGDHAVIADHCLDADGMDSVLTGIQGAHGSSGLNYQPWRIWSEDTLLEHAGAIEPSRHCVHTAKVVGRRASALE